MLNISSLNILFVFSEHYPNVIQEMDFMKQIHTRRGVLDEQIERKKIDSTYIIDIYILAPFKSGFEWSKVVYHMFTYGEFNVKSPSLAK